MIGARIIHALSQGFAQHSNVVGRTTEPRKENRQTQNGGQRRRDFERAGCSRTSASERRARVGIAVATEHSAARGIVIRTEHAGAGVRVGAEA